MPLLPLTPAATVGIAILIIISAVTDLAMTTFASRQARRAARHAAHSMTFQAGTQSPEVAASLEAQRTQVITRAQRTRERTTWWSQKVCTPITAVCLLIYLAHFIVSLS
jgi:hypothetical protein